MIPLATMSTLGGVLLLLGVIAVMIPSSSQTQLLPEGTLPEHLPEHPSVSNFWRMLSRKRRNVAQLAHLVDNYTPYRSSQLLAHGNWCGYGGDRAHDGSVRDGCDGCCRTHDYCYEQLLDHTTESLGVNDILSNLQVLGGPIHLQRDGEKLFLNLGLPSKSRRCFPYADLYRYNANANANGGVPVCAEVGGICSRAACDCDMEFVNCLRRTQCRMHG